MLVHPAGRFSPLRGVDVGSAGASAGTVCFERREIVVVIRMRRRTRSWALLTGLIIAGSLVGPTPISEADEGMNCEVSKPVSGPSDQVQGGAMISYSARCQQHATTIPAQVTVKSRDTLLFKATDQITVSGELTFTNSVHLPVPSGAEVCVTAAEATRCAAVSLLPNSAPNASFDMNCVDLTCAFTDTSTDDGSITKRTWDFGDGTSSTEQNPSHSYSVAGTYAVNLTVTDDRGATHSATRSVTVNTSPKATFETTCADLTCTFADTSIDPDGTVASWAWEFGDAATSTEQHPSHAYSTAGTYEVTLIVTDDGGAQDRVNHSVAVYAPLAIDSSSLPAAKKKVWYSTKLEASGGKPAYSWSVVSGNLPPGLSLSRDGTLSGTAKNPGSYSFTAQVIDQQEPTKSASRSFILQVTPQ